MPSEESLGDFSNFTFWEESLLIDHPCPKFTHFPAVALGKVATHAQSCTFSGCCKGWGKVAIRAQSLATFSAVAKGGERLPPMPKVAHFPAVCYGKVCSPTGHAQGGKFARRPAVAIGKVLSHQHLVAVRRKGEFCSTSCLLGWAPPAREEISPTSDFGHFFPSFTPNSCDPLAFQFDGWWASLW